MIWDAQGKTEEAITEFRAAIQCDPNNTEAHHNLGKALRDQAKSEVSAVR